MTIPPPDEKAIFSAARLLGSADARRAYLEQVCGEHDSLRTRVEALLRINDEEPGFLQSPAEGIESTPEPPISEGPGSVIGPYKLLERIGAGGFGVVFMAEQQHPIRRRVALKVIKPGMDTRQVIARFEAERQALALMEHPNIARVLDCGETATGLPYLVMELVRGVPITEYCDWAFSTVPQRLELFIHTCQAVQHAHQKGIIHRDIKPSNVLVTLHDGTPVVKVIDFGIAKAMGEKLTDKTLFTQFAALIGTPLYMSPEQAEMSGLDLDTRADIYALGVVLYELLTGTTPFDRKRLETVGIDEIRRIIREEEPPKPSTRIDALGDTIVNATANRRSDPKQLSRLLRGELDWIVMKCLEKDRTRRYATANGLARDIQRYLNGEAVEAGPPTPGYRLRKFARRHGKLLVIAAAFALVLAAATVVSIWLAVRATKAETSANQERDRAEVEAKRAQRQVYAAHMNLAQVAWEEARVGRVLNLLEQHRPKSDDEDLRGFEWYYWSRLTDTALLSLRGHGDHIWSVVFSRDGKRMATSSKDGTVRVWDATSGQELLNLTAHTGYAFSVAFSPDGKWLASSGGDWKVKIWDLAGGRELRTLNGHTYWVVGLVFSPDGKYLASASHDSTVKVWDAATGRETLTLKGHGSQVLSVTFSPDGKSLASASHDRTVKVWDMASGEELRTLKGHTEPIQSVAVSPDGKLLASASSDRTVRVWDAANGRELRTLIGHTDRVFGVAFSPDGKRLASGSFDQTVRLWDAASGRELLTLKGHTSWVASVAFSPDGKRLASAGDDRTVKLWDVEADQETPLVLRENRGVLSLAFSPDGKRLASGTVGKTVKVWDAESGRETLTLHGHTNWVNGVAFSPDGKRLASASADKTAKVWDIHSGREILTLKGSTGQVLSVAFSPDGKRLVTGGEDKTVRVWDATSGQETLTLMGHTDKVPSVVFSPDGKRIASGSSDSLVKLWDAADGQELLTLKGHAKWITSVAFSPSGDRLASAGGDTTVRMWDATTGQQLLTLEGHTIWVASVAFSPDGKRLASASGDKMVKVWDTVNGQETLSLKGHTGIASSVAFSPDGQRLASGSYDGTLRVWDARPWTPQLRIEQGAHSAIGLQTTGQGR